MNPRYLSSGRIKDLVMEIPEENLNDSLVGIIKFSLSHFPKSPGDLSCSAHFGSDENSFLNWKFNLAASNAYYSFVKERIERLRMDTLEANGKSISSSLLPPDLMPLYRDVGNYSQGVSHGPVKEGIDVSLLIANMGGLPNN